MSAETQTQGEHGKQTHIVPTEQDFPSPAHLPSRAINKSSREFLRNVSCPPWRCILMLRLGSEKLISYSMSLGKW